jgi:hypothetical protein
MASTTVEREDENFVVPFRRGNFGLHLGGTSCSRQAAAPALRRPPVRAGVSRPHLPAPASPTQDHGVAARQGACFCTASLCSALLVWAASDQARTWTEHRSTPEGAPPPPTLLSRSRSRRVRVAPRGDSTAWEAVAVPASHDSGEFERCDKAACSSACTVPRWGFWEPPPAHDFPPGTVPPSVPPGSEPRTEREHRCGRYPLCVDATHLSGPARLGDATVTSRAARSVRPRRRRGPPGQSTGSAGSCGSPRRASAGAPRR